jgi:NitT/TauT family transport system ATP-binding protein
MPQITLSRVSQQFISGQRLTQALAAVDLEVQAGEFVALVGPSGCGKSTALNLIAGLHRPTRGHVCYGGRPVQGVNAQVGYMTQKDNLLPWRTVRGNVGLALEVQRRPKPNVSAALPPPWTWLA